MVVSLALVLIISGAAHAAADPAETLRKAAAVLQEQYGDGQMAEVVKRVNLIKDAGLSYQPDLLVPLKGSQVCKSKAQLRVLAGMILFDANYAMIFGKKQEHFDSWQYLNSEVLGRLKVQDSLNMTAVSNEAAKALSEDISSPENQQKYRAARQQYLQELADKAASSSEAMILLIDIRYGAALESLYVASTLSLNEKWGDSLFKLFSAQIQILQKVDKVMYALKDSKYANLVHQPERNKTFKEIRELYQKKKGQLDKKDIGMILEKVKTARAEFIKPCK